MVSVFPVPYEKLAQFAGNLATCLSAGLGTPESLKMASRALANTPLAHAMQVALERVEEGVGLPEALAEAQSRLPAFFIPVIWAGEQTGRLDESLRYLEHHCRTLARPARMLRNTWLIPLAVVVAGSAIKFLVLLFFGTWEGLLHFLRGSLVNYAILGGVVWVVVANPFRVLRQLFEHLKLALPYVGAVERDLAVNRFFHVFSMLYAAAGHRVENMIRLAAQTVTNTVLRRDLLTAASEVQRGRTIAHAFEATTELPREQKDTIAAGDLAGKLDEAFERIANQAGDSLSVRLEAVNRSLFRLTMAAVVLSVAQTLQYVIMIRSLG